MHFEWDPVKAEGNLRKHGIEFAVALDVFNDPLAISVPDKGAIEERFVTVGSDTQNRILVVVFAWRIEAIRIISVRRASPHERRTYMEGT